MTPSLFPAIRFGGQIYQGEHDDRHKDIEEREGLKDIRESQKGFSPDGRLWLSRTQAANWVRNHEPDVYEKLKDKVGDGLTSEAYVAAKGIGQKADRKPVDLSHVKALVWDFGLFTECAVRLARDCGEVKYFCPFADAFTEPFKKLIGQGLEGVERVSEYWPYLDECDLIFVPDTQCGAMVEWLKDHSYPVAGAGAAERLELDRWYGRQMQKKSGLPVQETHLIKGITAAREFAASHKDYFFKVNNEWRGIAESFKHRDSRSSETRLDYIAYKAGPYKEDIVFICEEMLPGVEPGFDGATWEGELLIPSMAGYERKGSGYIGRVYKTESDFPAALRTIHEGLSPEFSKHKTKFFYSVEVKIDKDRVPYLLDPTIRLAAPGVAAIQTELIENYSEVVHGFASGERVDPVMRYKYCAAVSMESSEAGKTFVNIEFPKEMRQWVKLRMACKHGNDFYSVPPFDSLGSIIALGDSVREVVETVKDRAKEVQAISMSTDLGGLDELQKDIQEGKLYGINF